MSAEIRGGIPRTRRITAFDTTGRAIVLQGNPGTRINTKWLRIQNTGGNALKVYWTLDDFTNDVHYMTVAATTGVLEGPIELDNATFWAKAAAGTTTVEVMGIHRRG